MTRFDEAQSLGIVNQHNRVAWVDYAKALGILLVVYGHIARGLHASGITVISEAFFQYADSVIYSFHMPLFFFLSGYFFINSFGKLGASKLVFSKVDTIFYPYVVWSVIQGLVEFFASQYTNGNTTLAEISGLLWAPRAQFWFLYYLFFYFCVLAIVLRLCRRFNLNNLILLILVVSFFLLEMVLFTYREPAIPKILPTIFFGFLFYFVAGIFFSTHVNLKRIFNKKSLFLLGLLFIVGQYIYHTNYGYTYRTPTSFRPVLAVVSILFVVTLSYHLSNLNWRFLQKIGEASMMIFLMHIIISAGTRIVLQKKLGIDTWGLHVFASFMFCISIPLYVRYVSDTLDKLNKVNPIGYLFVAPITKLLLK